mmetsp:Transcript_59950/g.126921  ORF Transcript_59950/g.126921 Transcript_59950/m.126921 type:complete len:680 (+) Transcript_59950:148-2187(+)
MTEKVAERPQAPASSDPDEVAPVAATEEKPGFLANVNYRMPWWVVFFLGIFLLAKLQLVYNDSPCAVLGTQSPVTNSEIKRAFRTLSMCTHPDRLRGRLKRSATAAEERRGEIIFKRASAAKDDLTKMLKMKGKKAESVSCYEAGMESAMWEAFSQIGQALRSLGVTDYLTFCWTFIWQLVTLQAGLFNSIFTALWLLTLARYGKQFVLYVCRVGIVGSLVAVLTSLVLGPIPTLFRFLVLPFIRVIVFSKTLINLMRAQEEQTTETTVSPDADNKVSSADTSAPAAKPSTAAMPVATEGVNRNQLRQRKKKETEEEKKQTNEDLLTGKKEVAATGQAVPVTNPDGPTPMPSGLWQVVSWTHKEPVKARQAAACAVQFDLLLIMTKPVIPLIMLIALGQVLSGLWTSLFIGHALRRFVPQMSYEAHHLICIMFGLMHTVLGVSASQVEDFSNREHQQILHLNWAWSFKDILCVLNLCQLGSTVTTISALGNEPCFAASFASGIAFRMAMGQDMIKGVDLFRAAGSWLEAQLQSYGIALDSAEEVVAYAGGGIGDCGGGPFRMLYGDGQMSQVAAMVLKTWLLLLPLLATMQWGHRTWQAARNLGKRWKTTRFVQRLILFCFGVVQCIVLASVELNASNGALCNFWVALLFGCAGESLLSTYDIRGPVRQLLFLGIFLFI